LQGKDVAFICGSDEHGVAISMKAKKEGIRYKKRASLFFIPSFSLPL
jgi:methionyl-tRNA synthetase